jgi:hypothetical protein
MGLARSLATYLSRPVLSMYSLTEQIVTSGSVLAFRRSPFWLTDLTERIVVEVKVEVAFL